MMITLTAIMPTILLLILGNVLRRYNFLSFGFWSSSEKLTYFVLFPALLISKVSRVDLAQIDFLQMLLFVAMYFTLISVLSFAVYKVTKAKAFQFSSIYQGILRFNSYIYFAIVAAVWGQDALALSALIAGFMIPFVNVSCVAAFSWGSGHFSVAIL